VGLVVAFLVALAGCGEGDGGSTVSIDEAKEAFVFSYAAVLIVSIATAFGEEIEGVSLDQETNELTMDGFDLAGYLEQPESELPYSAMSGTVTSGESRMAADLSLEGGPVGALAFDLGAQEIQAAEGFTTTITVNGEELEIEITAEDLER
jgi:hypothetical protein